MGKNASVLVVTTLTLDQAQRNLPDVVEKAINGEDVAIKVGQETVRLVHDIPLRPPGYFAECYRNDEDATFEERICQDSHPVIGE